MLAYILTLTLERNKAHIGTALQGREEGPQSIGVGCKSRIFIAASKGSELKGRLSSHCTYEEMGVQQRATSVKSYAPLPLSAQLCTKTLPLRHISSAGILAF